MKKEDVLKEEKNNDKKGVKEKKAKQWKLMEESHNQCNN